MGDGEESVIWARHNCAKQGYSRPTMGQTQEERISCNGCMCWANSEGKCISQGIKV